MKTMKVRYYQDGRCVIPKNYSKVPTGQKIMQGDYYLEKQFTFIPKFKYNEKYKMPNVESDADFLNLCYKNCLLLSEDELKAKYTNPYNYWLEQLRLNREFMAAQGAQILIEGTEVPGISRLELLQEFQNEAKTQNERAQNDPKTNEPVYFKKSMSFGKGGITVSSYLYIRKNPRISKPIVEKIDTKEIYFDKPEFKVEPPNDIRLEGFEHAAPVAPHNHIAPPANPAPGSLTPIVS